MKHYEVTASGPVQNKGEPDPNANQSTTRTLIVDDTPPELISTGT